LNCDFKRIINRPRRAKKEKNMNRNKRHIQNKTLILQSALSGISRCVTNLYFRWIAMDLAVVEKSIKFAF
jgi:superfamily I DNA/RNA helicase